eukprot:3383982-Rhodomonas_salina.1
MRRSLFRPGRPTASARRASTAIRIAPTHAARRVDGAETAPTTASVKGAAGVSLSRSAMLPPRALSLPLSCRDVLRQDDRSAPNALDPRRSRWTHSAPATSLLTHSHKNTLFDTQPSFTRDALARHRCPTLRHADASARVTAQERKEWARRIKDGVHSPHVGYVSLFPMLLGVLDPVDDRPYLATMVQLTK